MRSHQFRIMSSSSSNQPWWREALTFSRSERIGIMVLLVLVISVWWVPAMFGRKREAEVADVRIDSLADRLMSPEKTTDPFVKAEKGFSNRRESPPENLHAPFPFDPNEASTEEWQRLGLSERTIATIRRFQAKGGRFRKPEDIGKIYGLSRQQAARLMPFVRIPASKSSEKPDRRDSLNLGRKFLRPAPRAIDINEADSVAWESLPGIGPTLAGRIVKYRNRLGGFHRMEQVGETYGLPDSVFRSIEPRLRLRQESPPDRIPINTATFEQLSKHPYIPYRLARAIIAYRDQHGPYSGRDDLMRIALMTTDGVDRIMPYLQF